MAVAPDPPLSELLTQARHLDDLLSSPGWALVREAVAVERERTLARLTNQNLPSHLEFAQENGLLRGLGFAEGFIERTLTRAQERAAAAEER